MLCQNRLLTFGTQLLRPIINQRSVPGIEELHDIHRVLRFSSEPSDEPSIDHGLPSLLVNNTWHDCSAVTSGSNDATSIPDIRSNGLQMLGGREVV